MQVKKKTEADQGRLCLIIPKEEEETTHTYLTYMYTSCHPEGHDVQQSTPRCLPNNDGAS